MKYMNYAAHVDHGVSHTDVAIPLGLSIVGAVAVAAFVVYTGGTGLAVLSLAGSLGGTAGHVGLLVGGRVAQREKAGVIVTGFDPVRLGPGLKPAARAHPDTRTDCGHEIVEGSLEVVLGPEFAPMSRLEDKEGDGGIICEGMSQGDVLVVGGPGSKQGVTYDENPTSLKIASLIYTAMGLHASFTGSGLSKLGGTLDVLGEGANLHDHPATDGLGTASNVVSGVDVGLDVLNNGTLWPR
jgi:hypothetical protein